MFPPEKTDDPYRMLQGVLGSLARAGSIFRQDVLVEPEEQDLKVTLYLGDRIPPRGFEPMRAYMRGYARECGWKIQGLYATKRYVRFMLAKAE